MRYLRPLVLQPSRLTDCAQQSWLAYAIRQLRRSSSCSSQLLSNFSDALLAPGLQEHLFYAGVHLLQRDEVNEDLMGPFFRCFWKSHFATLHLPVILDAEERVRVLEHLVCFGSDLRVTCFKHRLQDVKNPPRLGLEESYVTKRLLRSLAHLTTLLLWKVCDDAMLSIIGHTCPRLEVIDVWRSSCVTDHGISYLVEPGVVCRTLLKAVIKETSCTFKAGLILLRHCPNIERLESSQGDFLDLLEAACSEHALTGRTFSLKSVFLPNSSRNRLFQVLSALPRLEQLGLWTTAEGTW